MNEKEIKELQKEENELWDILKSNLSDKNISNVSRLIEINLELEEHCNK